MQAWQQETKMNEEQKKSAGIGCTGAVIFGMSNAAIIIGILNLSGFSLEPGTDVGG